MKIIAYLLAFICAAIVLFNIGTGVAYAYNGFSWGFHDSFLMFIIGVGVSYVCGMTSFFIFESEDI